MISNAFIEKITGSYVRKPLNNLLQICFNFWWRVANQLSNCENPQNSEKIARRDMILVPIKFFMVLIS